MKKEILTILTLVFLASGTQLYSQTGNVGIGTNLPQAKLHINGDVRIDSLSTTTNASQILTVDTVTKKIALMSFPVIIGDVKQGLQPTDHSGWIKLDGRALTSLTTSQETAAAALGLLGNLPDATNTYLSQNGTALGSVSGSNTKTIAQNNLPNTTLTGTTQGAVINGFQHATTGDPANGQWGIPQRSPGGVNTTDGADVTSGEVNILHSQKNHYHNLSTSSINGGVIQQPFNITPQTLSVNVFIYLGN